MFRCFSTTRKIYCFHQKFPKCFLLSSFYETNELRGQYQLVIVPQNLFRASHQSLKEVREKPASIKRFILALFVNAQYIIKQAWTEFLSSVICYMEKPVEGTSWIPEKFWGVLESLKNCRYQIIPHKRQAAPFSKFPFLYSYQQ